MTERQYIQCVFRFPFGEARRFVARALPLLLLLTLCTPADAFFSTSGQERTLTLYHVHTKESLTVTFKRGGNYDQEALEKLNWFLRDWRAAKAVKMDPRLFDLRWEVTRELGAKEP
ncbi:MAG: DUF882 domain-containing protein, partial [Methylobacteriaceae bacterium]|nr:DUF882 domain-containing protein [Methylobacteriaceae bacterium]